MMVWSEGCRYTNCFGYDKSQLLSEDINNQTYWFPSFKETEDNKYPVS